MLVFFFRARKGKRNRRDEEYARKGKGNRGDEEKGKEIGEMRKRKGGKEGKREGRKEKRGTRKSRG
jgi:hypothetical protein